MSHILSQEEIQLLLSAAGDADGRPRAARDTGETVCLYDFRRPDRIPKEHIRSLQFLHDRFARNVSSSLSAYLRSVTEVSILSVGQLTYAQFLSALPDPTVFYAVSMRPLEGLAALDLNPGVAFTMIDRLLGGSGRGAPITRALTEIEQNVIDAVVKLLLDNLTETWRGIADVQFRIGGRETRPQMLQIAAPNEAVLVIGFEMRIGETSGVLNLCIAASTIESVSSSFTHTWQPIKRQPTSVERASLRERLGRVTVSLTAVIDTSLPAREFARLRCGDVIAFDRPATQPVDVRVNGLTKFRGFPRRTERGAAIAVDEIVTGGT